MTIRTWMVYFRNSDGCREGNEYINAATREEAVDTYVRFFNVEVSQVIAIPVIGRD